MCMTATHARLSKSVVFVGTTQRDGKTLHVLGYQNTAQHLAGDHLGQSRGGRRPSRAGGNAHGNAMILPIPAKGLIGPAEMVSTQDSPRFLDDIAEALAPRMRGTRGVQFLGGAVNSKSVVQKFEHDVFTVVSANDVSLIAGALATVPEAKRPPLDGAIFESLGENYPNHQYVVCCFSNTDARRGIPLLFAYEPLAMYASSLFLPGLDAHDGGAPDLNAEVDRDHTLAAGIDGMKGGVEVDYRDIATTIDAYVPIRVVGRTVGGRGNNCDWRIPVADVMAGQSTFREVLPPGYVAR